jgi:hypothetical protein
MAPPVQQSVVDKYKSALTNSKEKTFTDSSVLVYGPPGVGKTSLVATVSEKFTGEFPNKGPIIDLDDLAVIQVDQGATDGYKSAGFNCHIIDYGSILADTKDPAKAISICFDLAASLKDVKYFSFDTVSTWGTDYETWLTSNPGLWTTSNGNEDRMAYYRLVLAAHQEIFARYRRLHGVKITVAHSKAFTDDLTAKGDAAKQVERKDKALALPGNASVGIDVTGKARTIWERANSLTVAVRAIEVPGGKGFTRKLDTEYTAAVDMATKNRFSQIIGPNPEFNLQALVKAIRA